MIRMCDTTQTRKRGGRAAGGPAGGGDGSRQTSSQLFRWWLPLPRAPRPLQAPCPPSGPGPGGGRPGGAVMSQRRCPWQRWAGGLSGSRGCTQGRCCPGLAAPRVPGVADLREPLLCAPRPRMGPCPRAQTPVLGGGGRPGAASPRMGVSWVPALLAGEGRAHSAEVGLAAPPAVAGGGGGGGGRAGRPSGHRPRPGQDACPKGASREGQGPSRPAGAVTGQEGEPSLPPALVGQHGHSGPRGRAR